MQYSKIEATGFTNRSDVDDIRRTATGEVDYYYYVELGRRERAHATAYLFDALRSAVAGLFGGNKASGHSAN